MLTRTNAHFTETSYTLIHALQDDRHAQAACEELMRIYWPSVYAFLRQNGKGREQAAELTQGFFFSKIINGKLLERYEADRGKLRSFLLASLKNYLIDEHRSEVSRGKGITHNLDIGAMDWVMNREISPEQAFTQRWATSQLEEAVRRCEQYFRDSGRAQHWEAFCDRVYHPMIHGSSPTPLNKLAPELGFKTPATVAAAVQLVKRRIIAYLREVVLDTTTQPEEAEGEFKEVVGLLGVAI